MAIRTCACARQLTGFGESNERDGVDGQEAGESHAADCVRTVMARMIVNWSVLYGDLNDRQAFLC